MNQRPSVCRRVGPGWAWLLMILTGIGLSMFIVAHILNVAFIMAGQEAFDHHAELLHGEGWMPKWLITLGILGLALGLIYHALNGIRIASKAYLAPGVTTVHSRDLKHSGTWLWNLQVVSGSLLAVMAAIHWGVIHFAQGMDRITAATSAGRIGLSCWVLLFYLAMLVLVLYHTFNGVRSVLVKLGWFTEAAVEAKLRKILLLCGAVTFVIGLLALAWFQFGLF